MERPAVAEAVAKHNHSDTRKGLLVFLVAGEASGDILGARLMQALKRRRTDIRFAGVGGERMTAEGMDSLFPMQELSLFGLVEVLPHIPKLRRRLAETVEAVARQRPDVVVTIDSPGFNRRLARSLKPLGIPLIHYVAPSVWAYRPGRAVKFSRLFDHLLALLPFEPPYFEKVGLDCTHVGHPAVEEAEERGDGAAFRAAHGIAADAPLLLALPGSRRGEVERHLPVIGDAVARLKTRFPNLHVAVPTVAALEETVAEALRKWAVPATLVKGAAAKQDAFAAADLAIAASGTVTVELAVAGVPMVVIYRTNPVTAWIARRLLKISYVSLINLVLDREAVPELLQQDCTAEAVARTATALLSDDAARADQVKALAEGTRRLGADGAKPSDRAAAVVLDLAARPPSSNRR